MSLGLRLRWSVLLVMTIGCAWIAISTTWDTQGTGAAFGFHLDNVDARTEYRSIYVGFFSVLSILSFVALRRIREPLLGNVVGFFLLGDALGRVVSFAIDGMPGPFILANFTFEATASMLVLLNVPRADERPEARMGEVGAGAGQAGQATT